MVLTMLIRNSCIAFNVDAPYFPISVAGHRSKVQILLLSVTLQLSDSLKKFFYPKMPLTTTLREAQVSSVMEEQKDEEDS